MKYNMRVLTSLAILSVVVVLTFQNCSTQKFEITDQNSLDEPLAAASPDDTLNADVQPDPKPPTETLPPVTVNPVPPTNPVPPVINPVVPIPDLECYKNYFSVFENPNNDSTLSNLVFLKAIKIYDSVFPPAPSVQHGWSISSMITTAQTGATTVSTKFLKKNSSDPDFLNCYFPPSNPIGGYENMGINNNLNILVGFLSSTTKYIRCNIETGDKIVIFQSADGSTLSLDRSKPFVIKRGCRKY